MKKYFNISSIYSFFTLFPILSIFAILFVFSVCLTGCMISIPDHNLKPLPEITLDDAKEQILQFNSKLLQEANIFNMITFGFRGSKMQALGITALDAENKTFAVAGFTPTGLTLFQIKVVNGKIIKSFVIPKFGDIDLKKATQSISKDIANIYFDRFVDPESQEVELDKNQVQVKKNNLLYNFGGAPLKLIQKTKYDRGKKIWSVDYYDYRPKGSKEIAHKIFLKHYKYGYFLDITTTKVN